MVDPTWYRTYFRDPYGEVYDEYLLEPGATRDEALFARDVLGLGPGDSVLDCPCGFARHMREIALHIPDVVGVDLDPDSLNRARVALPGARLVRGDMRALPLPDQRFDAALNLFNSFGYFADAGDRQTLGEFARVLKPGGRLLLDVTNPLTLIEAVTVAPQTSQQILDMCLTEDWQYDNVTRILVNHSRFDLRGKRTQRSYSVLVYNLAEIETMLGQVGLRVTTTYGGFDGERYNESASARLIVIATRS